MSEAVSGPEATRVDRPNTPHAHEPETPHADGSEASRSAASKFSAGLPAIWADSLGRASIRSLQILLVTAVASMIVWAATRVPLALTPVLIALILASAISPLVRVLTGKGWPRALAVLTSFVVILGAFAGVITGVVDLIRDQSQELADRAVAGIDQLHQFLNNGPIPVSDAQINSARDQIQKFLTSGSIGSEALSGLRIAVETATGLVLMAVILFFFLKDGAKIRNFLFGFLPEPHASKAHAAAERSAIVLGGYVRGTAIIAAIDGLIVAIALLILHVPLAFPLGVFVFIGGFIPIVGATIAGILAVLVALVSNGPIVALIVVAVLIGANQLEHHLLQPGLMGKVLHIHGLVILLALTAGSVLAGILGALLAVPITAVGWTIIKTWSGRDVPGPEPIDPDAPGAVV